MKFCSTRWVRELTPQKTNFVVYVILLNWNRCDDTVECLASLYASSYSPLHLLVVDQNSSDGSSSRIRFMYPDVEIIELIQNVGFARGMNAGIRHALDKGATHLLLLNNDTIVAPEMITQLVAQLQPDVGFVGPVVFYYDHPEIVWSIGNEIHPILLEMTLNREWKRKIPKQPVIREFLSGCAMLLPRETVEIVGFFDERFFMYYEDLDYCLRVGRKGMQIRLVPNARMWHKVSASSGGRESPHERYHMGRSSGLYFRKNMTLWRAPFIIFFRIGSAILWSWRLSRQGRWDSLVAYWRGLRDGWFV